MAEHNEIGKKGEQLATDHLIANGYQILERNWMYQKAEIDILALKDSVLAVVEVKTRTSTAYGTPEAFVSKSKINLLVRAINAYVEKKDLDVEIRFDIISILIFKDNTKIEHLENAFYYF